MSPFVIARGSYLVLMLLLLIADLFWLEVPLVIYLALSLLFLLLVVAGSSIMSLNFFTRSYTRLDAGEKAIAFTFDDGPSAAYTPAVLEVLERYGVKGSFFCIGERIEKNKTLVKSMAERGHLIGNHSYSHSKLFSVLGKDKVEEEIVQTNQLILEATGRNCQLFRPPYGVLNPPIAKAAAACKMKVIGWNIRSFDTATKDPEKVVARVLAKLKPGAVILLHDDREHTPRILEALLAYTSKHDYKYKLAHELIS